MFKTLKNIYNLSKLSKNLDVEALKDSKTRNKPLPNNVNHVFDDLDREKSTLILQQRKEFNHEKRKQELEFMRLELELQREQRIQQIQEQREQLRSIREDSNGEKSSPEDILLNTLLTKFLAPQTPPSPAPLPPQNLINQQIKQVQEDEEPKIESRFTDAQLKETIPKILNPQSIQILKNLNLNDEETYQLMDVIKSF